MTPYQSYPPERKFDRLYRTAFPLKIQSFHRFHRFLCPIRLDFLQRSLGMSHLFKRKLEFSAKSPYRQYLLLLSDYRRRPFQTLRRISYSLLCYPIASPSTCSGNSVVRFLRDRKHTRKESYISGPASRRCCPFHLVALWIQSTLQSIGLYLFW